MTPKDILNKKFEKAMGGFKADDVQNFLAEVADYIEDILDERAEIESKMLVLAEKLEEYREDEDSLRAALIGAQKLGDSVVRESKKKAEEILEEAQSKADEMIQEATAKSESLVEGVKDEVERNERALIKMKEEVAQFKSKIISLYEANIDILNTIALAEFGREKPVRQPEEQPVMVTLDEEEEPAAIAEKEFILHIEELQEQAEQDVMDVEDKRKKPRITEPLWFGEEYRLTRKD